MNNKRKKLLEKLTDYFVSKGKIMGVREYKEQTDTPIRAVFIPRYIGPWARIENLIANTFPEKYAAISVPVEEPEEEELDEETIEETIEE